MTALFTGGRRPIAAFLPCALFLLSVNATVHAQGSIVKPVPGRIQNPGRIQIPGRIQNPGVIQNPGIIKIDPNILRPKTAMFFYKLGASNLSAAKLRQVADSLGAKFGKAGEGVFVLGGDETAQGGLDIRGNRMLVVPDLSSAGAAPSTDVANRQANDFVKQLALVPRDDAGLKVREIATWTKQNAAPDKPQAPIDCFRSVHFTRTVQDLSVLGPNSVIDVTVGAKGVAGMTSTLKALQKTDLQVKLRSDAEIKRDFDNQLAADLKMMQGTKSQVLSRDLIYLEQGMQYAQPVYRYNVVFQSDQGTQSANSIYVQAAANSPEALMDMNERPNGEPQGLQRANTTIPKPQIRPVDFRTGELKQGTDSPQFQQTQAGGVKVGLYIVREDHSCWLSDANAFMSSLNSLNWITGKPTKTREQYLWNYPQYFHASGGNADQSRYFPGKVHMAWLEGHGAPWIMTTYKDYGSVIHANQLTGLGANTGLGETTTYMVWQGCDIVPVPGDSYGADYSSGSAFDVWWRIFKGMRGAYGYHTTMGICNQVGAGFGLRAGMGIPNLSSWLSATASNPQGHPDGWNYGSAVIVTGHENDTLYNTGALPNPSQLTIWWNHP